MNSTSLSRNAVTVNKKYTEYFLPTVLTATARNIAMIVYQSTIFSDITIEDKKLKFHGITLGNSISKINLLVFKHDDFYEVHFNYRNDLYKEETIHSFAETYLKIIDEFLHKKGYAILTYCLMSKRQILTNSTKPKMSLSIQKQL